MRIPKSPAVSPPPLFEGLDEADTNAIMAKAVAQSFPARSVLCRQGEPAESFFLIQRGRVRFARTTPEGRDVLLRWLCPGECFGLASLVTGQVNYMATGVTMDLTEVYLWRADEIRAAAAACPTLTQNVFRIVLRYLEAFTERHQALLSKTAEQRVARTLTHLGATCGRILPTGVEVDITNQDLAALADVGMFTVSRQLKHWERDGHLIKRRQHVLLRHPEALLPD